MMEYDELDDNQIVINEEGSEIYYNAAVYMMDDEIREELHGKLAPCTAQEFFSAYEKAHEERFGEIWGLSKK